MNERDYLIWLSSVPGLSLKRQKKMIKIFGSAHDIWTAPEKLILMLDEFPKNILENIINYKNEKKIIAYQNLMAQNKIRVPKTLITNNKEDILLEKVKIKSIDDYYDYINRVGAVKTETNIGPNNTNDNQDNYNIVNTAKATINMVNFYQMEKI